jgi:AbrB family transcriptional regulator (stage V sporulation protein T)
MKATGIVRRIDDLGRVVIPKEIRRTMRIKEGAPLEIYTESNGTVIFKKYSPIGELSEFAGQYAEALAKAAGCACCVADKEAVIAVSGASKKELFEKKLSVETERIMNNKAVFVADSKADSVSVIDGNDNYKAGAMAPIIFEGDSIGAVILLMSEEKQSFGETDAKLAEVAASFLGKTVE